MKMSRLRTHTHTHIHVNIELEFCVNRIRNEKMGKIVVSSRKWMLTCCASKRQEHTYQHFLLIVGKEQWKHLNISSTNTEGDGESKCPSDGQYTGVNARRFSIWWLHICWYAVTMLSPLYCCWCHKVLNDIALIVPFLFQIPNKASFRTDIFSILDLRVDSCLAFFRWWLMAVFQRTSMYLINTNYVYVAANLESQLV